MASLEERPAAPGPDGHPRSNWRAVWRHKTTGKKTGCTFGTKPLAERAMKIAEAHQHALTGEEVEAHVLGQPLPDASAGDNSPTVSEWAHTWLKSRTRISPGQRRRYRSQLDRIIIPCLGADTPIRAVDGAAIVGVLDHLRAAGRSSATRTRYFAAMSSMFGYAVREKSSSGEPVLDDNPCDRTDFIRDLIDHDDDGDDGDDHVYLSPEQYMLIHSHMAPFGRPVIDLLVGVGARWSEATAIAVDKVIGDPPLAVRIHRAWKQDEDGGWYLGPTKGRTRRTVDLEGPLPEIVRQLMMGPGGRLRARENLLLTAPDGGRCWHSNFVNRYWAPAIAAAMRCAEHPPPTPAKPKRGPVRKLRPSEVSTCDCPGRLKVRPTIHDLRHTYVAWAIAAGHPLTAISRSVGHRSTEVTERVYAGILPAVRTGMASTIGKAMRGELTLSGRS